MASRTPSPVLIAREVMAGIEHGRHYDGDGRPGHFQPQRRGISPHQGLLRKKTYKDPQKQTYSGDLLDKHAASFTRLTTPFQPRLLRKAAQSALSQYRYYTAPAKRRAPNPVPPQGDAQHMARAAELYRSQGDVSAPAEHTGRTHSPSRIEHFGVPHSHLQQEEDLKYLRFLEALTNDLMRKGCKSRSAMENVFQDHLTRNGTIEEWKKEILVQELREELERNATLDFSISYDGRWYGSENLPRGRNLSKLLKI